jgi:pimeloyl-ACP methyl ester carboxylesterase
MCGREQGRRSFMIGEYFKEAFVEAGGFRIRYLAGGSGHPIVFLHGGDGLGLSPALDVLTQRFRVIAFEIPENQSSAAVEDLARGMNAAVTALGIERYSLMGTSFGSQVALWMAILRPDAVEAIVLSAPAAPPRDESFAKGAAELTQPVLVLFGTVDASAPPEGAHLYRRLLQNCHITLVYNAGHAIDVDRPEAFASLVGDFLTRKEQFVVRETTALIYPERS